MAGAIEVRGLSVSYGDFYALDDVSFSAPEGAFVGIIGPNGAGKSTLIRALLGLEENARGDVKLLGNAPAALPAKDIGYVPQMKSLDRRFPATAVQLVATGLLQRWPWRLRKQDRDAAIEAMKVTRSDALADRAVQALSGGELQRVYLARSLVRRPRLVFWDEPASGMDAAGEAEMYHLLEEYCEETQATAMIVTHDWEGARVHASHVLLLDRQLVDFGPPADVAEETRLLQLFGHAGHVRSSHRERR